MHNELNYCKVLQRHLLPRLAFYFSPSPSVEQRKQHHILPAGLKLILKTRIHNECEINLKSKTMPESPPKANFNAVGTDFVSLLISLLYLH